MGFNYSLTKLNKVYNQYFHYSGVNRNQNGTVEGYGTWRKGADKSTVSKNRYLLAKQNGHW